MSDIPAGFGRTARVLHWTVALSILGLMSSGWAIYNAAPFYGFEFPAVITLGGYLTPALRWHFAFMWVLALAVPLQIGLRLVARQGGPSLTPVQPARVMAEIFAALRMRLGHSAGVYIHTQRLLYLAASALFALAIVSGLALWKPVQLQLLTEALGGYEAARRWHFWAMAALAGFTIVHLAMVAIVPSTLAAMLFGATPVEDAE